MSIYRFIILYYVILLIGTIVLNYFVLKFSVSAKSGSISTIKYLYRYFYNLNHNSLDFCQYLLFLKICSLIYECKYAII